MLGPVAFSFSENVVLYLPEVKLVRGDDPLLLLGTDLLSPKWQGWGFMHVGYDPRNLLGVIAFSKDRGAE